MCPGMLHAKFQSPSIYIDRHFQLSDILSYSVSHSVSQSLTQSPSDVVRCRAVKESEREDEVQSIPQDRRDPQYQP